ncbi:MAG: hypothetical protein KDE53_40475, partial [Caldilineaceae bacterium]|nr:hypothetical protein [Caldilineaceae bacterium]
CYYHQAIHCTPTTDQPHLHISSAWYSVVAAIKCLPDVLLPTERMNQQKLNWLQSQTPRKVGSILGTMQLRFIVAGSFHYGLVVRQQKSSTKLRRLGKRYRHGNSNLR